MIMTQISSGDALGAVPKTYELHLKHIWMLTKLPLVKLKKATLLLHYM